MTRQSRLAQRDPEAGGTLVLVLIFLVLLSLLGSSLLFTTDVELRTSQAYLERNTALSDTDSAVNELLWRLNLTPGAAAPPAGSTIDVNANFSYDASLDYDPDNLLSDGLDNDLDGFIDEPDELNLARDWELRVLLRVVEPSTVGLGSDVYVLDLNPLTGPPWGNKSVVATIQPHKTWRTYSTIQPDDPDVLVVRFKLDTDTVVGDSEGDGAEIVFYDPLLATDTTDDKNTLTGLGGDANPANDSPYNITWSDGVTTYPATGHPVLVATVTARGGNGQRVVRRQAEIELSRETKVVYKKAICSCNNIDLAGSVDSYKSSEGLYGAGPVYNNGDIGANGSIALSGGGIVTGTAEAGTTIKLSGTINKDAWAGSTITTTADVLGTSYPNFAPAPQPCDCDAYNLPKLMAWAKANNDNASILPDGVQAYEVGTCKIVKNKTIWKNPLEMDVAAKMSIILPGGVYYMKYLSVHEEIQVGQDTDGDCIVDTAPTEPVRIYVEGDVDLFGKGIVNGSQKAEDLQIYVLSASDALTASGSFTFRGTIYHPGNDCSVSGGAVIEGALVCGAFKGGGDGVHFDEDLSEQIIVDDGVAPIAWREIR